MLSCKDSLYAEILRNQPAESILINSVNELIGRRQKGGEMIVAKGDVAKNATSTGAEPTGLGRWNYVDIVNSNKKLLIMSSYQCLQSRTTIGTAHLKRRRYFLARNANMYPYKLFIINLD